MSESRPTGPAAVLAPERFSNPRLGTEEAAALAAEHWGIEVVAVSDVGSLQDRNFRLRDASGKEYALKVANAAVPRAALEIEHAALRHLAGALDAVAVPRPLPVTGGGDRIERSDEATPPPAQDPSDGSMPLRVRDEGETPGSDGPALSGTGAEEMVDADGSAVRLMTWVPGVPMAALGRLNEADLGALGAVTARVGRALADFAEPARPGSQWDTRIAIEVVEAIEPRLAEADRVDLWRALGPLQTVREGLDERLPRQWIHADVTDVNVIGGVDVTDHFRITGLIDFGDLVHTWRVCDPAAAIVAAIAAEPNDPLEATLAVLRGYLAEVPLEEPELDALWPTVLARAAVCFASSRLQDRESPGHDYVEATLESDRGALTSALTVPAALARAAIREAAGHDAVPGASDALRRLRALDPAPICSALDPARGALLPDSGSKAPRLPDPALVVAPLEPARGAFLSPGDRKAPHRVGQPRIVDFGVASAALGEGAWLDPYRIAAAVCSSAEDARLVGDQPSEGSRSNLRAGNAPSAGFRSDPRADEAGAAGDSATAVGRWGEARLIHAGAPGPLPPATLHLGVDLFLASGTAASTPLAGEVLEIEDDELTIALDGFEPGTGLFLRVAGLEPTVSAGETLERGAEIGRVLRPAVPHPRHVGTGNSAPSTGSPPAAMLPAHLHLQLAFAPGLPGLGDPRRRAAWTALCPDPSPLLGFDAAAPAPPDPAAERARREAVLAGAQSLYYEAPMEIVRGWRATLIDSDARPYLDVVNNIAAVGHSHPGVAAAATEQLRLLNTNSRFLYDSLTEYAERIAALLPDELDRVFVVNSGSEALDLAVQLARVHTGRRDLAVIDGAYHGWTESVYEACTSPQDNPGWEATKPPYVHVVDQPDPFRGRHGDDAAGYVDSVRAACAAAAEGGGLAAFLAEALLGNQGAVAPPAGYLARAYEAVREAGGLCIADEVQVGFARTGVDFWAFKHEGVVPDIVAAAKATGNGHPVGVVACRAEIAESFGRRASFFSSTGGGPVSCRVGLAVLDAIRDERLQEQAARVGGELKRDLEALAARHPAIGAVNGRGLYLGVDVVVPGGREPDPTEASAICERMRELGVIVQPTGDAYNLLKVKPPMCLGEDEAAYFVAALDQVLGERERRAAAALDPTSADRPPAAPPRSASAAPGPTPVDRGTAVPPGSAS